MRSKCLVIIICISLLFENLYSQNPIGAPLVSNFSKSVFNGGSRTWDINQDRHGIMYFGNNDGLLSYDGKYWKIYRLPNYTIVRSIHISSDDRIYVGGQGEFGYFQGHTQKGLIYHSLYSLIPKEYRQFADIWHTKHHNNGFYFMSSKYIFEYKSGKVTVYPALEEWDYMKELNGTLYAQDRKSGLLKFVNNKWELAQNEAPFKSTKISGMIPIGKDSLLVGFLDDKVYIQHNNKLSALPKSTISSIYTSSYARIDESRIVIGTSTEGCQIRDVKTNKIIEKIGVTEGLQNKNVTAVYVDRQQNIWAAIDNAIAVISYGSGVRYIRPNIENEVTGFSARVFDNNLYLSSSNGVYMTAIHPDAADQSQSPGQFKLIQESDGGEAWRLNQVNGQLLLTHNKGTFRIERDKLYPIKRGAGAWLILPLSHVYPITESLVGTYNGLDLMTFNGENNFLSQKKLKGTYDSFRFLVLDDKSRIWASHPYRGIYKIALHSDKAIYNTKLYTQEDGLPSSYQNYVFNINRSTLFATSKGIYEYNETDDKFYPSKALSVFKGIPVKYMVEDQEGNIWFSSEKKVGVALSNKDSANYSIVYFPEMEGMNTSGFENIYPFNVKNIYVGSEKGTLHINFDNYRKNKSKPAILLSQVQCIGSTDSTLYHGYQGNDLSELNSSLNSFRFKYASPNYGIHEHVLYSYYLEGYDNSWSMWSNTTEKDYTNLPPGTYTFKVKAINNLKQESDVLAYHFRILPPWYKSIWAYLLYVVISCLGVYQLALLQKKAWQKQHLTFQKEMEQLKYIHQLEVEKNEKEIVKLQNEKLETEVMLKTKELASTSMQLMENSDALSKLRIELTKLATIQEGAELKRVTTLLKDIENNTAHWEQFATHFDELNNGFLTRLKEKHTNLSRNDLKVCAYLRLNFTSKQIAQLQSISVRGVEIHRYRIRKKLSIPNQKTLGNYLEEI